MKKVGILTFHRALNYGAVLQAFALRKAIEKLGVEAKIIDYGRIGQTPRFSFEFRGVKPFLANMILNFLSLINGDVRRYRFKRFRSKNMRTTKERYKDKNSLIKGSENFDFLITGSDQVWNPQLNQGDFSYLLDFEKRPEKKIAFAASFGVSEIPKRLVSDYMKYLLEFKHLSVREAQGQQIIKDLTCRDSSLVLDPTLLLNTEEWSALAKKVKIKKPYVLFFNIMDDPPGSMEFCKRIQKQTGYEIVRIANPLKRLEKGIITKSFAGPRQFIGLIKNANLVVTNSFHGTAFSIIFKKPFFTFLYNNDRDIRLKEITEKIGLEDRLVNPKASNRIEDFKEIDYDSVYEKLNKEQEYSIRFLKEAIEI